MAGASLQDLVADLRALGIDPSAATIDFAGQGRPSDAMIGRWAEAAAIGAPGARDLAIWAIRQAAQAAGITSCSIQDLYMARARGEWSGMTVPAMNLRGATFDICRAAFRAARALDAGLFIFEQSVTEAAFAEQTPAEFTAAVLAAALREGHQGPVFLQADHDQVNARAFRADSAAEIARLERIMRDQVAGGFRNIDIDASTVVDLALPTVRDQQRANAELTAHFTRFVRGIEPDGVTISLGAEIGEVGHHNTTPEEVREFMATYLPALGGAGAAPAPVSKISINSGTYHGGKMLADGTLAPVNVDYALLREVSDLCRSAFGMAGVVQHGASTLPGAQLAKLPETGAVEVHLALGFNNLIFDHPALPKALQEQIRDYTFANHAHERAPGETDGQFLYNTRKKAWKVLKQPFWEMQAEPKAAIMASLQGMFHDMFTWMRVGGTRGLVTARTRPTRFAGPPPAALRGAAA